MPKLVKRVGKFLSRYVLSNFHHVRKGYLNILSFSSDGHAWECMHRGNAVIMLPVDYERQIVYLIAQPRANFALAEQPEAVALLNQALRYGSVKGEVVVMPEDMTMIDVPAGVIDKEDGDTLSVSAVVAALRELEEETGIVGVKKDVELVSDHYVSVGGTTERHLSFFIDVTGNPPSVDPEGDGTERIEVYEYTFAEARELLAARKVRSSSLAVLLRELFLRLAEEKLSKTMEYMSPHDRE